MSFEQWFDQRMPKSDFPDHMMLMREAFREVAQQAWEAAVAATEQAENECFKAFGL